MANKWSRGQKLALGSIVAAVVIPLSIFLGSIIFEKKENVISQNAGRDIVLGNVTNNTYELINEDISESIKSIEEIKKGIQEILARTNNIPSSEIQKNAENVYQVIKNNNGTMLLFDVKKTGMILVPLTWHDDQDVARKAYIFDIVGELKKNRMSAYILEKNKLVYEVLTDKGKLYFLDVDIELLKKKKINLVFFQFNIEKKEITVHVNKEKFIKKIQDLNFGDLVESGRL